MNVSEPRYTATMGQWSFANLEFFFLCWVACACTVRACVRACVRAQQ